MRVHQLLALSGLMLMSNVAAGAKLEHDDVPNRCWNVCGPVVDIANKCDGMHHDNDSAEIKCICDWNQAPSLVPLCEACIAEYRSSNNTTSTHDHDNDDDHDDDNDTDRDNDRNDPHDNDAYDILTSCKLSTTSYNPSAATSALSSTGTSPSTADATATSTGSGSGSSSGSGSTSGSNSGSGSTTSSGSNAQTTDNAAPAASVPKAATMAAVMGLGFLAWL